MGNLGATNANVTAITATGNANVGNLGTAGLVVATGNVTGGNLVTAGQVTASGNITGNYLLANITFASGYNTTRLFNGTSEANIGTSGGNANITIGGVSNVAVFSTVGANITGTLGVTGNITGGNVSGTLLTGTLTTAAQPNVTSVGTLTSLTATGNVTGGNLITTGTVSTGTLTTSGNATVAGNLTVSGNVISVNVTNLNVVDPIIGIGRGANDTPLTTNDGKDRGEQLWYYTTSEQSAFIGYKNSTGKIIAATNVSVSGEVVTVNSYGNLVIGGLEATTISATGNANVGNLGTAGQITATGNITGGNVTTAGNVTAAYFLGNVSQASGIFATKIFNGTSEANIVSSGGNLAVTIGSTPNVMVVSSTGVAVTGTSTVSGNANVGNLGTSGLITATGNVTGGNLVTSGLASIGSTLSVTGNANVGNLGATNANLSAVTVTGNANVGNIGGTSAVFTNLTGTLTTAAQPNITSVGTLSSLSVTGNITGGNLSGTLVTGTLTTAAQPNVTSVGSLTSLTVTGNANVGNLGTSGLITATGNVTGGNLTTTGTANIGTLAVTGSETIAGTSTVTGNITGGNLITAGLISATGNITGGNILGNGRSLTGINAFSTISITGQSDVVADNIADTLTLVAGNNISITTNATTDTITISYSSGGTGQSPFLTNPNDFGLITEAYTDSQDLGSITEASSQNIDLGTLVTSGLIYPDQLVLPTYTVATLPSATIPAQFIYVSNAANGAITAFSDGTNWRRTSDRSIVT